MVRRQQASWRDGEMAAAAALVALGLLALVAVHLPPAWQPTCLFKGLTGLPCLTCGSFRATAALCAGEPGLAMRFQPLLTLLALAGPAWVAYAAGGLLVHLPRLRVALSRREVRLLAAAGLLAMLANWLYLVRHGV